MGLLPGRMASASGRPYIYLSTSPRLRGWDHVAVVVFASCAAQAGVVFRRRVPMVHGSGRSLVLSNHAIPARCLELRL